jgi:hypothetical protein
MKTVSLKIDDDISMETEKIISELKLPRNRYINEAIDHYNHLQKRLLIEKALRKESFLVRENSMKVLREFEDMEDGD